VDEAHRRHRDRSASWRPATDGAVALSAASSSALCRLRPATVQTGGAIACGFDREPRAPTSQTLSRLLCPSRTARGTALAPRWIGRPETRVVESSAARTGSGRPPGSSGRCWTGAARITRSEPELSYKSPHPLPDISVHVVQTQPVRLILPQLCRTRHGRSPFFPFPTEMHC